MGERKKKTLCGKINRVVSMKIAIEDGKKCNIPMERERAVEDSCRRKLQVQYILLCMET